MKTSHISPTYVFKGKKIDRKQFDQLFRDNEQLVIASGATFERGTFHLYLKEDDLVAELKGTPSGDDIAKVREGIRKMLKDEAKESEDVLVVRHQKEDERVTKEYLRLSKETGLPHDSLELLQKAIDAKIINSAILFDGYNYTGTWKVVGKGNLQWIGFNDRASSFKMILSVGCLCQNKNFGGRRYWTFGINFSDPDLRNANFDNIASSVWL